MNITKTIAYSLILILSLGLNAQTILIESTNISFQSQLRPCLSVNIDPEENSLKKAWTSYIKMNHEIKFNKYKKSPDKNIIYAEDITLPLVSLKRMNLYTRFIETTNGSEMKLFSSFGYDFFIGPDSFPKEFEAYKNMMYTFLTQYLTDFYSDEIKETSKRIKKLDKENIKLKKCVEKNRKKINNMKREIASLNAIKETDSKKAIEALEKINSITNDETKLENENAKNTIDITMIEEKLILRKSKLLKLQSKQKGLIN